MKKSLKNLLEMLTSLDLDGLSDDDLFILRVCLENVLSDVNTNLEKVRN